MLDPEYRNQFKRRAVLQEEARQNEKQVKENIDGMVNDIFDRLLSFLLEYTEQQLADDLAALSPSRRIKAICDILAIVLPFVRPKLKSAPPKPVNSYDDHHEDYIARVARLAREYAAAHNFAADDDDLIDDDTTPAAASTTAIACTRNSLAPDDVAITSSAAPDSVQSDAPRRTIIPAPHHEPYVPDPSLAAGNPYLLAPDDVATPNAITRGSEADTTSSPNVSDGLAPDDRPPP